MGTRPLVIKKGMEFDRLTILYEDVGKPESDGRMRRWFMCQCTCGNQVLVRLSCLRNRGTKSCGCHSNDALVARSTKHGFQMKGTFSKYVYNRWRSMMARCYDPSSVGYDNYGGRGITVCAAWHDFREFLRWVIEESNYQPGLENDRQNNDGNYEPSNCSFVTREVNMNNRSDTVYLSLRGHVESLQEWSRSVFIKAATIRERLLLGWSDEEALTIRPGQKKKARTPQPEAIGTK